MHEIDRVIAAARSLMESGRRGILVTAISTSGSTYRRAGARAVIAEDGSAYGLISGGCVERDLAERIEPWLERLEPRLITYDSTSPSDIIFGTGLGCRGTIEMLIEPFDAGHPPDLVAGFRWCGREPVVWSTTFQGRSILQEVVRPQKAIAVFGGGTDVSPVLRIAEDVGWRAEQFSPARIHPEQLEGAIDLASFDAAVVMTHNFLHDATLLELLLPSPIPYVGLLGPRRRGVELVAHIGPSIHPHAARLRNPIGLDLGGETPDEIALSIVAEVQSVLNDRSARGLRERHEPIHAAAAASSLS